MKTDYVKIKLIESDSFENLCIIKFSINLKSKTKRKVFDEMRRAGNRFIVDNFDVIENN